MRPTSLRLSAATGHGHGKVGLAGTGRTHAEGDGLRTDVVEILLLHRSLRTDHASFIGKDHIIMELFGGILPFVKERELSRLIDSISTSTP